MNELLEFSRRCGISEKTIMHKWKNIPGIHKEDNKYTVEEGTRYPFSMRGKTKLNNDKRRFFLLDAIFHDRYIDYQILRTELCDFQIFLTELQDQNLVKRRNCTNTAGANNYITTPLGDSIFKKKRTEQFEEFARIVGISTGRVVGETIQAMQ